MDLWKEGRFAALEENTAMDGCGGGGGPGQGISVAACKDIEVKAYNKTLLSQIRQAVQISMSW